ncbi:hypothetical protein ROZALSC1DRAFT_20336 [Rozella allomycis CSF55]|uniref:Uncharacterized protein n=1 Tax=Rozella allomycis (strain CSF55) TaxID=988480 RepID=A0A4P9YQT1_ROZAC|nr:hypothetical protein ROZALSC1DRAFT_20336 [Rozella allomycis CSF55]
MAITSPYLDIRVLKNEATTHIGALQYFPDREIVYMPVDGSKGMSIKIDTERLDFDKLKQGYNISVMSAFLGKKARMEFVDMIKESDIRLSELCVLGISDLRCHDLNTQNSITRFEGFEEFIEDAFYVVESCEEIENVLKKDYSLPMAVLIRVTSLNNGVPVTGMITFIECGLMMFDEKSVLPLSQSFKELSESLLVYQQPNMPRLMEVPNNPLCFIFSNFVSKSFFKFQSFIPEKIEIKSQINSIQFLEDLKRIKFYAEKNKPEKYFLEAQKVPEIENELKKITREKSEIEEILKSKEKRLKRIEKDSEQGVPIVGISKEDRG